MWIAMMALAVAGTIEFDTQDEVILFDVDWEEALVAYKVVAPHPKALGATDPFDCGYAGMAKRPYHGVMLGIEDLNGDRDQTWVVYAPATKAEDCTAEPDQQAQLKAAKEAMDHLGLSLDARPDVVENSTSFTLEGHKFKVGSCTPEAAFVSTVPEGRSPMCLGIRADDHWLTAHQFTWHSGTSVRRTILLDRGVVHEGKVLIRYEVRVSRRQGTYYEPHWVMVDTTEALPTTAFTIE